MTAFIPLVLSQVAEAIDSTSLRSWVYIEIPYFGADNILVRVTAVTIGNRLNDSIWIDEITSGDFAVNVTVRRFVAEAEYSVDSNTTTFIYIASSREYKIARTGDFPWDYWKIGITLHTNFEAQFDQHVKYFSIPSPYYYGNCTTTYGYEQQGYYYYSLDLEIQHPSEFGNFIYLVFCPPIILLVLLFLTIFLVTAFLAIKSKDIRQIESTLIAIGSAVIVFIPVFQLSTQELKTPFTITWIDYCFLGLLI
jgi:hypothetical protein